MLESLHSAALKYSTGAKLFTKTTFVVKISIFCFYEGVVSDWKKNTAYKT